MKKQIRKKEDRIMTIDGLSNYLGLKKSYLYKLTHKGIIPHYKPLGKKLFFSKNEVDEWVKTYFEGGEE